jgi:integrase
LSITPAVAKLESEAELAERVREGALMIRKAKYRTFQRGTLLKRGKRRKVWVARWREDGIGPNGRVRIRRSEVIGVVSEMSKSEAEQALVLRLVNINSGTYQPKVDRTFRDFVREQWEPVVPPTLKYSSQQHYKYLLDAHLIPAFGDFQLRDISRDAVQKFIAAKLASGRSWKTVKHARTALGRVLASAEEWGLIQANPVRKTKMPRRTRSVEKPVLTVEQVKALIEKLDEPAKSIVLLLAATGMRVGELLALRWRNADLDGGLIFVREAVYEGRFDTPKSKRSKRAVPLGPKCTAVLKVLRPSPVDPDALVFSSTEGTVLDRHNLLNRYLRPACVALNLTGIGWHSFRHCNATLHDAAGTPLGTVQAVLGHSSAEITRDVYIHSLPSDAKAAAKKVGATIFGPNLDPRKKRPKKAKR